MSIDNSDYFYGAALKVLLDESEKHLIQPLPTTSKCAYSINNKAGIYIKYSRARVSPWRFTFKKEQQEEIKAIKELFQEVFLILVCKDDGFVCISYAELKKILDDEFDPVEWISAARSRNSQYTIKGSNGKLNFKVSHKDFPRKINTYFKSLR